MVSLFPGPWIYCKPKSEHTPQRISKATYRKKPEHNRLLPKGNAPSSADSTTPKKPVRNLRIPPFHPEKYIILPNTEVQPNGEKPPKLYLCYSKSYFEAIAKDDCQYAVEKRSNGRHIAVPPLEAIGALSGIMAGSVLFLPAYPAKTQKNFEKGLEAIITGYFINASGFERFRDNVDAVFNYFATSEEPRLIILDDGIRALKTFFDRKYDVTYVALNKLLMPKPE